MVGIAFTTGVMFLLMLRISPTTRLNCDRPNGRLRRTSAAVSLEAPERIDVRLHLDWHA